MANDSAGKAIMAQGRILWVAGDLFKGQKQTMFGSQTPKLNQAGEQIMQYGFGLAIPKTEFAEGKQGAALWAAIYEEAFQIYPNRQLPPAFALKYKDGDGVDDKGLPFNQREGYAGHLVFAMTTSLPIKFFRFENGMNIMINDGIKCGDYVNVQVGVRAHGAIGQGKPGMYLNPNAVQFLGYGKEIINAPSGDQVFGAQAPPLPPGASATPLAQPGMLLPPQQGFAPPAGASYPGAPQQFPVPAYGAPPGMQPPNGMPGPTGYPPGAAPMGVYPGSPQQAPAPHYAVVPPALVPPQYAQPPQPGAPPGYGYAQPQQAPTPGGFPAPPGFRQ